MKEEDIESAHNPKKSRGPKRRLFTTENEVPYNQSIKEDEKTTSLQDNARKYIEAKNWWLKSFTPSSCNGNTVLVAGCDACKDCSKAYAFSMKESIGNSSEKIYFLLVEEVGSCTDNKNEKRFKKEYAKNYAFAFTPGNLDTFME